MQCTKCRFDGKLSRTKRVGLFEEHLYPFFGYFPWICSMCKRRILVKNRGERRHSQPEDMPAPPHSQQNRNGLHQVQ
jgi:hypothetical protein